MRLDDVGLAVGWQRTKWKRLRVLGQRCAGGIADGLGTGREGLRVLGQRCANCAAETLPPRAEPYDNMRDRSHVSF